MANIINAITTGAGGLSTTADTSGNVNIQSNGSTVLSTTSSGVNVTGAFTINGAPLSVSGGATTTTGSSNITLTSSSNRVQVISMTAANLSVTLPDATTISSLGGPIFQFVNAGYFPYSIKDGSGGALYTLSAGDSTSFSLTSNSTAAGTWVSEDAAFNVTASDYATVTSSFQYTTNYAWLDNNFNISSDAISTSSAIVTWQQGTTGRDVYGAVVSYSGSTITVGTPTLIYSGSTTASVNNAVKMLSSTNGLILIQRASDIVCVPFTVSGSAISVGTTSSTFGAGTASSNSAFGAITAMSSTVALVSYRTNTTSNFTWVLNTITHNGASAPTLGTASATVVSTQSAYQAPTISKIDSTTAFIAYNNAGPSYYPVARIATLSGTSAPTLGTANTTSTDGLSNDGVSYPIYQISSTQFLLIGGNGSAYYTVSGTTVTYVSSLSYSSVGSVTIASAYPGKLVFLGTNVLGTQYSSYNLLIGKIASNALYLKPSTSLPKSMSFTAANSSSITALDSTTALGFTSNGTSTISATIIKYIGI